MKSIPLLYLTTGQSYRWNTLIFHFVYIANNLFKGLLIGFSVYSLDLEEQTKPQGCDQCKTMNGSHLDIKRVNEGEAQWDVTRQMTGTQKDNNEEADLPRRQAGS